MLKNRYAVYVLALMFAINLLNFYDRSVTTVNANVGLATHGQSVSEVLGNGSAAMVKQQFTLRQGPLTYLSAPTPNGIESTLNVFVNGIQWHEVDSLDSAAPSDRSFVTGTDDKGMVTITLLS